MSQQVYITDRIYTGVDIDEHCVAIFVSLHPSCIISASRSPQWGQSRAVWLHDLQVCNMVYLRVSSPLQDCPSQPSCSLPCRSIPPGCRRSAVPLNRP